MTNQTMSRLIAAALIPLAASPAAAQTFQSTQALDAAVAGFTGHAIGSQGGARAAVDTRLKLAACPTVALSWFDSGHSAVVVRCAGPEWRIFVPVIATPAAATAPATAAAAVPARPAAPVIKRGDPVTIEVNAPGFSISRDGIAMGDAAPGGRLLISVDGAKKPVQAIALESGRVTLPGWTE